jgi:hypothetical protein
MKKIILFIFFTIFIYNSKINSLFAQSTCKNDIDFSWGFEGPENYRNAEFQIRNNSNKTIIISKLTLFTKDNIEMTSSNPNANLKPFGVIKLVLLTYDLNRALAMSGSVYCKYP